MEKLFTIFLLFTFHFSLLTAVEVGGHLTEDTIWSPENNPYEVTEVLYVDESVTLTILPGTEIKISAAPFTSYDDYMENFVLHNGVSVAKYFWVDGKIIAEGTEENGIIITRLQDENNYFWGTIYITESAGMCQFQYCKFEYAQKIGFAPGNIKYGAVNVGNNSILFRNNLFLNNHHSILFSGNLYCDNVEITDNKFDYTEDLEQYAFDYGGRSNIITAASHGTNFIICNNKISNARNHIFNSIFSYNQIENFSLQTTSFDNLDRHSYIYKNTFSNASKGIDIDGDNDSNDSLFIKSNKFYNCTDGIDADYSYVEICDNYFEDSDVSSMYTSGKVFNNTLNGGTLWIPDEIEIYNNICYNSNSYGLEVGYNLFCSNNVSVNNEFAIWSATELYNNCIIIGNEDLTEFVINGTPTFRNCIIDFPLEDPLIDGGGNIWVTPAEAQQIFVDMENGDFHLAENSIAIDAGFDTLGYYSPFDLDYSQRVWDGNGDGNSIIDIGPYEFGAPQLGTISGYITEPNTNEPVKYVLIKPNNNPSDFVIADSTGYFELQLQEGNYDLYCHRVFYEDTIEYNVNVENEIATEIYFTMTDTLFVANETESIEPLINKIKSSNYPNPFNPATTIKYYLPKDNFVNLTIYNVKGQKIKKLVNEIKSKGNNSVVWNGKDGTGNSVSSGVYFYKIKTDNNQETTNRMILLK